jgi:hypothetical protein
MNRKRHAKLQWAFFLQFQDLSSEQLYHGQYLECTIHGLGDFPMAMGNTCSTPGTPGQAKKKMPPAPDPYELEGDSTLVGEG